MPRPNILLITSDQQHYSTLGSINPRIQTPGRAQPTHRSTFSKPPVGNGQSGEHMSSSTSGRDHQRSACQRLHRLFTLRA